MMLKVAIAGNPNVGKTSLFNQLTGSRHRVGNYPGVTVERRIGRLTPTLARETGVAEFALYDLPGTYSLTAMSEDEAVAFASLSGADGDPPDAILLVLDATNLARNLYLALQLLELGRPLVIALNLVDTARLADVHVDVEALQAELGVPVVETIARSGEGIPELVRAFAELEPAPAPRVLEPPDAMPELAAALERLEQVADPARARWLLLSGDAADPGWERLSATERQTLAAIEPGVRERCQAELIELRYRRVDAILAALGRPVGNHAPAMSASERIDRVLTHKLAGLVVFVAVMAVIFVAIFTWAEPFVGAIEGLIGVASEHVADSLGPGLFTELVTDGIIAGVGNVLVFIPHIALLFLFLGLLEDSGYLARAAFLLDRLMARLGLHGRAFIPLLSGYACAIPAILGTRTISSTRDRLVTILMIPYMSCSARLPIYALLTAALFVPEDPWVSAGFDRGLVLLSMYLLSTVSALTMGVIFKRTILRSPTPPLVLELPPYRFPRVRNTLLLVYERTRDFVINAGSVILAFTIVLWALLSFPAEDTRAGEPGPTLVAQSYGGRAAQALEPALQPIGQDWRVGVGIIGSFAAREVLVSTLGLVYGLESADDDPAPLREAIRDDVDPRTGERRYTPLSGLALMVFFVYACMCMSTLAVVRRETHSWRWPVFMFASMTGLAYIAALVVFQGGRVLGF